MFTAWHLLGFAALLIALLVNGVLLAGWVIIPFWRWFTRPWLVRVWRAFKIWWLIRAEDFGGLLLIVVVLALTWVGLVVTGV